MRKYLKTMVLGAGIVGVVLLLSGASRRPAGGAGKRGAAAVAGSAAVAGGAVEWMTVEQAADKLQQEKRPVLIDLYTTWCGWCREMDRKTYSSKKVAAYLAEKFYTVKVDAETRAAITWQGRTYAYSPQYRANEFALFLTHGRLEFPTTIILMPGDVPQAIPGFMEPGDLEPVLKYFGEGAYKTQGFDVYMKNFKKSW
jgi:thioredoxin-related protein